MIAACSLCPHPQVKTVDAVAMHPGFMGQLRGLPGLASVKPIADGIISDLFSFSKLDDSTVARELAITDSEHSDAEVSCTENGTFNLSRGQTPLTEGSEGENLWPELIVTLTFAL